MGTKTAMIVEAALGTGDADDLDVLVSMVADEVRIHELGNMDDGLRLAFTRAEWEAVANMVAAEYARLDALPGEARGD